MRIKKKISGIKVVILGVLLLTLLTGTSVYAGSSSKTSVETKWSTPVVKTKTKKVKLSKKAKKTKTTSDSKTSKDVRKVKRPDGTVTKTIYTTVKVKKYYKKGSRYVKVVTTTTLKTKTVIKIDKVLVQLTSSWLTSDKEISASRFLQGKNKKVIQMWKDLNFTLKYDKNAPYTGRTSYFPNEVCLRRADEKVFCHELGHIICTMSKDKASRLEELYRKEKSGYTLFNKAYVTSSKEEFFAECYALWEIDRVALKKMCPLMCDFVGDCVNTVDQSKLLALLKSARVVK